VVRLQCGRPARVVRDTVEALAGGVEAGSGSVVPELARHPRPLPGGVETWIVRMSTLTGEPFPHCDLPERESLDDLRK